MSSKYLNDKPKGNSVTDALTQKHQVKIPTKTDPKILAPVKVPSNKQNTNASQSGKKCLNFCRDE